MYFLFYTLLGITKYLVAIRFYKTPLFYPMIIRTLFLPVAFFNMRILHTSFYQEYSDAALLILFFISLPFIKKLYKQIILIIFVTLIAFIPFSSIIIVNLAILVITSVFIIIELFKDKLRIVYWMLILYTFLSSIINVAQIINPPTVYIFVTIYISIFILFDLCLLIVGYGGQINIITPVVLDNKMNLLTKRESEILLLVGQGLSTEQIADKLFLAKRTVDFHRSNIKNKIGTHTIGEMIVFAREISKTSTST